MNVSELARMHFELLSELLNSSVSVTRVLASMDRFEDVKLQVKEASDIVRIVERHVSLRSRGRTLVGLCPFHNEKTPSFTVYPSSQHFKCYGCGKAGDVFTFLQEREGLSFREAMEQLAEAAAISLDGVFGRGRTGGGASGPKPFEILGQIRDWFVEILHGQEGEEARSYLQRRGLWSGATPFGLGAHPRRAGALLSFARDRGLPRSVLEAAGLIGSGGGEIHRGRLMFPITDERGRVVGFGGRVLPSAEAAVAEGHRKPPKYLNSPESPVFRKRRLLYGFGQVKDASTRRVVVCEGYTDVIACHLAGFDGAVATLGTALTTDHAKVLERWAHDGVVLLFDGDQAGRRAADRAFRELVHTPLPVRIALLDEGDDPADLVSLAEGRSGEDVEAGRARLAALIDRAPDALTVWFRLMRGQIDMTTDAGVQRAARECAGVISGVQDEVRREALVDGMARHLGIRESALRAQVHASGRRPRPSERSSERATESAFDDGPPLEQYAAGAAQESDGQGAPQWSDPGGEVSAARPSRAPAPEMPRIHDPLNAVRLDVLACALREPALIHAIEEPRLFGEDPWSAILAAFERAVAEGRQDGDAISRRVFSSISAPNDPSYRLFAEACDRSHRMDEARSMFDQAMRGVAAFFAKLDIRQLRLAIDAARGEGDTERVRQLSTELMNILRNPSHRRETGS